ncbi:DNA polymerase delta catalytic subunit [Apostasia shenzhenica]|uniref:DNA polymerase n=1 Tax=Apostasia shenzhenica TaxID=1088818 RepID=A0A2I0ASC9_9ASPA|nr:DNA polymerase delta catalytic subunit [Apostasia shenzhenica]
MASQSDSNIFSVRIVSLDYCMSPPIPDLDFCYSSFQGAKVEEVPVIRIYGATPAGQKTCLHVHGVVFFILVIWDISLGFKYTVFFVIFEPAPLSVCSIVLIPSCAWLGIVLGWLVYKLGYSENSPGSSSWQEGLEDTSHHVKASLQEVDKPQCQQLGKARDSVALVEMHFKNILHRDNKDGSVLSKSLQPYESHIPYHLQFLVDYNLYGMSHLHASKVKFRSPVPDCHNAASACHERYDKQANRSRHTCVESKLWLSSSVSSVLVWQDSTSYHDSLDNKYIHLTRRQSTCELEADASAEDIINQKFRINTSLSQSDVRMVQSLIPIWEEECERSGIQEETKHISPNRPLSQSVLRSFLHGIDYNRTLCEFIEACNSFRSDIYSDHEDNDLDNYLKSFNFISKVGFTGDQRHCTFSDIHLLCGEESKNKEASSSQNAFNEDLKCLDIEALGLLSWLASSHTEEEIDSGDQLLHEAILSPSLPAKSYRAVLEIAHRDYEQASQIECLDILDSVEVIPESDGSKEQASSSSGDIMVPFTSGVIPQLDGSFRGNINTPLKGNICETNVPAGGQSVAAEYMRKGSMIGSKSKRNTLLWGTLPFFLRSEGMEVGGESGEKSLDLCSIRDLMRKRRCLRGEKAEADHQKEENKPPGQKEEPIANEKGSFHSVSGDMLSLGPFFLRQNEQNSKSYSSIFPAEVQSNILQNEHTQNSQQSSVKEQNNISIESRNPAAAGWPVPEDESRKLCGVSECKYGDLVLHDTYSRVYNYEKRGSPLNRLKSHSTNHEESFGNKILRLFACEYSNAGNVASKCSGSADAGICDQSFCISKTNSRDFHGGNAFQELIEMTFINKPPADEHIYDSEEKPLAEEVDTNETYGMEKIVPFFPWTTQDLNSHDENLTSTREPVLGIPTHFQNDGSVLYLLTHALTPPSMNNVQEWLLGGSQQFFLLDKTDACTSQHSQENYLKENGSVCQNFNYSAGKKMDDTSAIEKVSNGNWHDLSQISAPDKYGNSNPTPLSQIGFRDPASLGGGQQLTLISMEVSEVSIVLLQLQAESRGDLRPDPKYDAINVLSLVVQEDTSSACEVYILMRAFDEKPCQINNYGISDGNLFFFTEEKLLLQQFVWIITSLDPDILMGWEIQGGSLGYLAERALHLGLNLLRKISRTPFDENKGKPKNPGHPELFDVLPEAAMAESALDASVIGNEWGRAHASGLHVGGRIVLNIWRLMRAELKLNLYTAEAVAEAVLRQKIPFISSRMLNLWYCCGPGVSRHRCIEYVIRRAKLNIQIMDQLDMINRTSELARIFGIDFFSVISRGSQFRVESMLLRLAHTQNYLAISPGYEQVASQPAMECLPLVMEPESGFYIDPVVVLDFQSLYPSMIIAYNLCFCTCLGNVISSRANVLGVSSYFPDVQILKNLRENILLTPNGVMYAPPKVRRGVLPRLLDEILSTRIMVKQAMKKLMPSQLVLKKIFNSRQLALKLIANVTYGYTAAGFSGRMPCAELADSIVQCGRRTLETTILIVNQHKKWKARVIYGDTDSMFVLLKGRSRQDAFRIGNEIASEITKMNPEPVTLKMEKVYHPCFLLTKKRYVGYSYESPEQEKPTFDAKGIETVRRDTCPVVAKTLERSIRLIFETQDLSQVKSYLHRQWARILSEKVSLKDFVFAKEVRLGAYSSRASSLPPAAIVAKKAVQNDPRAVPLYGERVRYVVIHGEPGCRLVDMVVDPCEILDINSPYRLNDLYYINKQIIPTLQRVFGLLGADLNQWFSEIPRVRPTLAKCLSHMFLIESVHDYDKKQIKRSRIDTYYSSKHCALCGVLVHSSTYFCESCSQKESLVAATVVGRASKKERELQHLAALCVHCGGGDWIMESSVQCMSLSCSVFYERRKIQKELRALSSLAVAAGFHHHCDVELF